jgi:hypothetical protein
MTEDEMHERCIEAFRTYRKAMHKARWAYLNELGAFHMQDAANGFRRAAKLLESVSVALLQELPQYSHLFQNRVVKKKARSLKSAAGEVPAAPRRVA